MAKKLSVIVPAFNEEAYIGPTLEAIQAAASALGSSASGDVEVIVVDNNSSDATASIAREKGAKVIHEPMQGIARARNAGARHAVGDALVFVDADVVMPAALLELIRTALDDPACIGGGVDVAYRPRRFPVRLYLRCLAPPRSTDGHGAGRNPVLSQEGFRGCRWV